MPQATMWFTQSPDCYGGKSCNKIVPRWHCYADGDKDSDYQHKPLVLDPRHFPPGTKITVEEPVCPDCGDLRRLKHPAPKRGSLFVDKCACGFDWETYTLNCYS